MLGGDIVDEYTTKEQMEEVFSLIGTIKAPVYFIYGNHDRQPDNEAVGGRTFTDQELESAILNNGIKILKDEWVSISDDLLLFGREDYSRAERKPLSAIPKRPDLYISSGASGWSFPFRTEAGCHYEVITLKPSE